MLWLWPLLLLSSEAVVDTVVLDTDTEAAASAVVVMVDTEVRFNTSSKLNC